MLSSTFSNETVSSLVRQSGKYSVLQMKKMRFRDNYSFFFGGGAGIWPINTVVVTSAEQPRDSAIHIHVCIRDTYSLIPNCQAQSQD